MNSVIEVVANLLRIRGDDFIPGRIDHCSECNSDKIVFPKSRGRKKKNESRGINWRCSERGCTGFQSTCTVVVHSYSRSLRQCASYCWVYLPEDKGTPRAPRKQQCPPITE